MQEKFNVTTLFQDRIVITKRDKKGKPKKPDMVEQLHERWFFALKPEYYAEMQKEWVEHNLKIKLTKQDDYDQWLNYFKTLSARKLQVLSTTGMDILDAEAYSALLRWRDIITNPHRIDKIHQSGLTKPKGKEQSSIIAMALANDRLGVLKATRDQIAEKLDKGAGARDTAALAREMTEIMTQIADYEKRAGPKKDTMLGQLLGDMTGGKTKRASRNGKGARNTSFHSRVTIEDTEA